MAILLSRKMAFNMAYITLAVLFYLVALSDAGKSVEKPRDIVKEFEDFKTFVASEMEAMAKKHARDVQQLKDIINAQGMRIQKLEDENVMKNRTINELEQKLEDMSLTHCNVNENAENALRDDEPNHPKGTITKAKISSRKRGKIIGVLFLQSLSIAFILTTLFSLT